MKRVNHQADEGEKLCRLPIFSAARTQSAIDCAFFLAITRLRWIFYATGSGITFTVIEKSVR